MSMPHIGFPLPLVILFGVLAISSLVLDVYLHRKPEAPTLASAGKWSVFYVIVSLIFAGAVYLHSGAEPASMFLTGYVMEKVLSVDNLAVFIAIFAYFGVKVENQHRVLHYGVIGAIVFRLILVTIGSAAFVNMGTVTEIFFAAVIAYTAYVMWCELDSDEDDDVDFNKTWYIRYAKKIWPVDTGAPQGAFITRHPNPLVPSKTVTFITPLLLCLVAVEMTDLMFSFDSVPTVIAVTQDPFLVFTSMVFAILGLRSLYFILAVLMDKLEFLPHAIIAVLVFVAAKLGLHGALGFHIEPLVSLYVVLSLLCAGIGLSWLSTFKGRITT